MFKHLFCKHHYLLIAHHKEVSESLWKCERCSIHYVYHSGLGLGYKTKNIPFEGWVFRK